MKMRFPVAVQWLSLATLCALPAGCKKPAEATPAVEVTVEVSHPTYGAIAQEIQADALLAPLSEAAVSPRISAPIKAEYVQRGAHVRRGQLLVSLDARDLAGNALDTQGALAAAQANYTAVTNATIPEELKKAQLEVTQLKTALEIAQKTAAERQRLFAQGAFSGRDADSAVAAEAQARSAYEIARDHADAVARTTRLTDEKAAQGQLTSARGKLENAQAQAGYASLRSPIDGIVTERPLFPGETAAAGTPVITVMDTSSLLAKLHMAQATAQGLSLGSKATVAVPGLPDAVAATVSFISPALDPGSSTVEVWLKLPNAGGRLKVGTSVHASITGTSVAHALQIPTRAILPGEQGGTGVMIVGADGAAHKRAVTLGIRTADAVQVLSGLWPADSVITDGGFGLDEGTRVQVGANGAGNEHDAAPAKAGADAEKDR